MPRTVRPSCPSALPVRLRGKKLPAILGAGVAVLIGPVCGPAAASSPPDPTGIAVTRCGQVVTGDAYLAQDLQCAGQGIIVEAYSATLDLAGHTLAGDGTGTAVTFLAVEGEEWSPLVVRGGRITDWDVAVGSVREGTSCAGLPVDLQLDHLEVERSATVVCKREWLRATIVDSTLRDNGVVFSAYRTVYGTIERSHVEDTRLIISGVAEIAQFTFLDSTFIDNDRFSDGSEEGSLVIAGSHVEGSIEVIGWESWTGVTLEGNTFRDNGVVLDRRSSFAQVTDNVFEGNVLAVTAAVVQGGDRDGALTLTGNTFRDNVDAVDTPEGADVHLQDNVSYDNAGWGIHAPGATDLGGNRAWGNGNQPQCVGVVCKGQPS